PHLMSNFSMSSISGSDAPRIQTLLFRMISSIWSLRRPSPLQGVGPGITRPGQRGPSGRALHVLHDLFDLGILDGDVEEDVIPQIVILPPSTKVVAVQTTELALLIGRSLQAVIERRVFPRWDADGDVALFDLLHPQPVIGIGPHNLAHMVVVAISRVPSHCIEGPIDVLGLENTQENPARRVPDLPVAHRSPPYYGRDHPDYLRRTIRHPPDKVKGFFDQLP